MPIATRDEFRWFMNEIEGMTLLNLILKKDIVFSHRHL